MWGRENATVAGSTTDSSMHTTTLLAAAGTGHQVPFPPSPRRAGDAIPGQHLLAELLREPGPLTQSQDDTAASSHILQQPPLLQADVSLRKSWQAGHAVHAGRAAPRHRQAPAHTVACVPHQLRLIYKLNFTLARSRIRHRCWRSRPPPLRICLPARPTPLLRAGIMAGALEELLGKAPTGTGDIGSRRSCHARGNIRAKGWGPGTRATPVCCWHGTASKTAHLQPNEIKAHPRVIGFPRNSGNAQIWYVLQ